jgi:hypothetical protein
VPTAQEVLGGAQLRFRLAEPVPLALHRISPGCWWSAPEPTPIPGSTTFAGSLNVKIGHDRKELSARWTERFLTGRR